MKDTKAIFSSSVQGREILTSFRWPEQLVPCYIPFTN